MNCLTARESATLVGLHALPGSDEPIAPRRIASANALLKW
jgi:hypothetical protein